MKCVFCDNFAREITFLESKHFRCIYNKAPILPGHSLVISKKHVQSLRDLNSVHRCELMRLSDRTEEVLLRVFEADSLNWTIQDRPPAGQTVPHFHLHIIPRFEGDLERPGDWYPRLKEQYDQNGQGSEDRPSLSQEELKQITLRIRKHVHQEYRSGFVH